jgi:hypothetical protein
MDPITIFTVLSGLLAGGSAIAGVVQNKARDAGPITVRTVWTSRGTDAEHWRATELLSERALAETGKLFDLDLMEWWPMIESGFYRAVVLAELSGDASRHVVLRARKEGLDWVLDVAYGAGGAQVKRHQLDRIAAILRNLSWASSLTGGEAVGQQVWQGGDGTRTVWMLDSYLRRYTSKRLGIDIDQSMISLRQGETQLSDPRAYAIVDPSTGNPTCAFILGVQNGVYTLADNAMREGGFPVPSSSDEKVLIEFEQALRQGQAALPGTALPGESSSIEEGRVPESRRLPAPDEIEDFQTSERGREYAPTGGTGVQSSEDEGQTQTKTAEVDAKSNEIFSTVRYQYTAPDGTVYLRPINPPEDESSYFKEIFKRLPSSGVVIGEIYLRRINENKWETIAVMDTRSRGKRIVPLKNANFDDNDMEAIFQIEERIERLFEMEDAGVAPDDASVYYLDKIDMDSDIEDLVNQDYYFDGYLDAGDVAIPESADPLVKALQKSIGTRDPTFFSRTGEPHPFVGQGYYSIHDAKRFENEIGRAFDISPTEFVEGKHFLIVKWLRDREAMGSLKEAYGWYFLPNYGNYPLAIAIVTLAEDGTIESVLGPHNKHFNEDSAEYKLAVRLFDAFPPGEVAIPEGADPLQVAIATATPIAHDAASGYTLYDAAVMEDEIAAAFEIGPTGFVSGQHYLLVQWEPVEDRFGYFFYNQDSSFDPSGKRPRAIAVVTVAEDGNVESLWGPRNAPIDEDSAEYEAAVNLLSVNAGSGDSGFHTADQITVTEATPLTWKEDGYALYDAVGLEGQICETFQICATNAVPGKHYLLVKWEPASDEFGRHFFYGERSFNPSGKHPRLIAVVAVEKDGSVNLTGPRGQGIWHDDPETEIAKQMIEMIRAEAGSDGAPSDADESIFDDVDDIEWEQAEITVEPSEEPEEEDLDQPLDDEDEDDEDTGAPGENEDEDDYEVVE